MKKALIIGLIILGAVVFSIPDIMGAAENHISINSSARLGNQVLTALSDLRRTQSEFAALDAIMAQCVYNDNAQTGGINYSHMMTLFGITNPDGSAKVDNTSAGQSVQYQFDVVTTDLNAAAIVQLLAQLG